VAIRTIFGRYWAFAIVQQTQLRCIAHLKDKLWPLQTYRLCLQGLNSNYTDSLGVVVIFRTLTQIQMCAQVSGAIDGGYYARTPIHFEGKTHSIHHSQRESSIAAHGSVGEKVPRGRR
jgi:hypothetical protein